MVVSVAGQIARSPSVTILFPSKFNSSMSNGRVPSHIIDIEFQAASRHFIESDDKSGRICNPVSDRFRLSILLNYGRGTLAYCQKKYPPFFCFLIF